MDTKNVIVTGATGKIGFAIAQKIAEKEGYRVWLAARNEEKAKKAVQDIINVTGNEAVDYLLVDTSSKKSIENLASRFEPILDVLVNNAAATPRSRQETEDGIEMQWATNVLGYFWMIEALLPHLKKADQGRIVNVASYWAGDLDLDDPEFKHRRYNNDTAYRQSKQADRMLTAAFAERFKKDGISVNSCHPGDVNSSLSNNLGYGGHESPEQGAATPVLLATGVAGIENTGAFFSHGSKQTCQFCQDKQGIERLFQLCQQY